MTKQYFQRFLAQYRPFKSYWNYEDGCVLTGCRQMYAATGETLYADFVLDYLTMRVKPDGTIPSYLTGKHCLDSFNSGRSLFFAKELTHDPRYEKAIRWQASQITAHPRTESGMPWHKGIYPQQVWIDGVYMTAPFFAEYAAQCGDVRICEEIGRWFTYLEKHLRDAKTGLYYHALDESRTQRWANPDTGLSQSFWLRGEGWFLMALCDTAAVLPPEQEQLRNHLGAILRDAVSALLLYRRPDGLLCQVIDRPSLAENYTETSGNLMTAYALMRGAELRMLPDDCFETGLAMLETVKREKLCETASGTVLCGICRSAGLGGAEGRDGSTAYYLSEPVVSDDPKGVGVLMMAEAVRLRSQCAISKARG